MKTFVAAAAAAGMAASDWIDAFRFGMVLFPVPEQPHLYLPPGARCSAKYRDTKRYSGGRYKGSNAAKAGARAARKRGKASARTARETKALKIRWRDLLRRSGVKVVFA